MAKVEYHGCSAFLIAAANGRIEAMQWLLEHEKAFLTGRNNDGYTAFHIAAAKGYIEVMQWLLEKEKAFLTARNNDGDSALDLAIKYKIVEVITYILKNHMISYKSPLQVLDLSDDEEIINLLRKHKEYIDYLIKEEGKIIIDDKFICPIISQFMIDPISAADGRTYEKKAIVKWLKIDQSSPVTREPMTELQLYRNLFVEEVFNQKLSEIDGFLLSRFASTSSLRGCYSSVGFFAAETSSVAIFDSRLPDNQSAVFSGDSSGP